MRKSSVQKAKKGATKHLSQGIKAFGKESKILKKEVAQDSKVAKDLKKKPSSKLKKVASKDLHKGASLYKREEKESARYAKDNKRLKKGLDKTLKGVK